MVDEIERIVADDEGVRSVGTTATLSSHGSTRLVPIVGALALEARDLPRRRPLRLRTATRATCAFVRPIFAGARCRFVELIATSAIIVRVVIGAVMPQLMLRAVRYRYLEHGGGPIVRPTLVRKPGALDDLVELGDRQPRRPLAAPVPHRGLRVSGCSEPSMIGAQLRILRPRSSCGSTSQPRIANHLFASLSRQRASSAVLSAQSSMAVTPLDDCDQ
jgi:hypothetical protein